jgi:isomaltose glucohydrolase
MPSASTSGADLAARSVAVIDAGQAPGGAYVAGPTFSQYGYAWLRDGSFIAEAMDLVGRLDSSGRFHAWVTRLVLSRREGMERAIEAARGGRMPGADEYLHCRYTLDGRVGDDEWPNFQLDGPGIWLWSLAHHRSHGGGLPPGAEGSAGAVATTARYLAALWRLPCADAWEESPDRVHTSTLAAVLAGLRAAMSLEPWLADEPEVRSARDAVELRLLAGDGPHTKWDGADTVDASLLWMAAPYGLVAPDEPPFAATLARIEADLVEPGGGVHRHRDDTYYGGGEWPVLASAYARVLLRRRAPGDLERAREVLAWIEAQADDAGDLPEQTDAHALAPQRVDEWRERWGESARPLLWSHAAYLALATEVERAEAGTGADAQARADTRIADPR